MFIYSNGDSFTNGDELASDILPNFPGWSEDPPFDVRRVRNHKWLHVALTKNQHLIGPYMDECRRRAYPQKLANLLKCELFNNALGGGSMDYIARNTIIDLIDLKKKGTKDIIAVIGTTSIFRIELPIDDDQWLSTHIGSGQPAQIPSSFTEHYVKKYSVIHAYSNYYKNLILIQEFCKVNDIRLILVDVMSEDNIEMPDNKEEAMKIDLLKQYAKPYDFSMSRIAHKVGGKIFAPCGHFSTIVHDKLAQEIVKII
jgi:hypothetical protein